MTVISPDEILLAWQSAPAHVLDPHRERAARIELADPRAPAPPQSAPPTAVNPTELSSLGHQIRGMASHIAASTCEWLHLIEQFDRHGGWAQDGSSSCAAWLAWACSISPSTAREYVRVARALPGLPLVDRAFSEGRLSYSKVRVIVKAAETADEEVLLSHAEGQTVSQLERTVRAIRRHDGWDQERRRRASWHWDDDGMLSLSARLPADEGALLLTALNNAREDVDPTVEHPSSARRNAAGDDDQRAQLIGMDPSDVTRANMLVALAERALSAAGADRSGDDRHLVVVHADLADVTGTAGDGGSEPGSVGPESPPPLDAHCAIQDGPGLSRKTAQRIACDASLVAMLHNVGEGEPLRLGRKTRSISSAQRRALRARDGGCRFPGCHRRTYLEAHHVRPWSLFGKTDLDNLILVCRFHHMLVHEGGYRISPHDELGWEFRDRVGSIVPMAPPLPGRLSSTTRASP